MAAEFFSKNVGTTERAVRVVIGLGLLSLVFVGPQTLWGLLAAVPLVTGLMGTCPPYTLLGISTCRHRTDEPAPS